MPGRQTASAKGECTAFWVVKKSPPCWMKGRPAGGLSNVSTPGVGSAVEGSAQKCQPAGGGSYSIPSFSTASGLSSRNTVGARLDDYGEPENPEMRAALQALKAETTPPAVSSPPPSPPPFTASIARFRASVSPPPRVHPRKSRSHGWRLCSLQRCGFCVCVAFDRCGGLLLHGQSNPSEAPTAVDNKRPFQSRSQCWNLSRSLNPRPKPIAKASQAHPPPARPVVPRSLCVQHAPAAISAYHIRSPARWVQKLICLW